jgi:hypothetical protein
MSAVADGAAGVRAVGVLEADDEDDDDEDSVGIFDSSMESW